MAASATPVLAAAPAAPPARPRVLLVGTAMLSAASFVSIMGLVAIYLARRADTINNGQKWLPRATKLPLTQPTMMLFTLGLSLITVIWAANALRRDDKQNAYVALGLTLLFAVAFVNQYTYFLAVTGLPVKTEPGMLILTISAVHLFFTFIGIGFLVLIGLRTLFGQYRRVPEGITAAAMYWFSISAAYAVDWYAIFVTK